ncbi:MAG: hypothetical protein A2499_11930 [Stygiobacter sp. RIFOXYC12_FULL_38_8]|nr:MAG: hypothetical protein A2X62_07910 [Stygiobacter sp. GWC2_38_9]OGU77253.1 MAG: hypothetical protein A2279_03960 [Stygiobacter sp. RIFOXYA12_FULL_38_9]OGV05797.1 MAG: hypothetical protein A2299_10195 [Stygiobacter sp. RIFOXYB2_FULL_37_11]OGV13005.1 MAG: hypothetical protein A2440_17120 [Stygiobacter sp. RIFOXYC2_FULL_38_25]OGV14858.1 MAG: hypothetical protein A2237_01955 [Stygiobacter sp. RIFOXYA2_FULL_38_8]OGV23698.1 MAG: hypothetical protein A2499_11930 [Stygiobacter sp. RIFOXYC12_FULL_
MLQITLEPQGQIVQNPSHKSNDWDFKLKVVREGDLTELRVCFEDSLDSGTTENLNSIDVGQEGQNKKLL